MIKSVWFDLDGTLLINDVDIFLKEYFKLIALKIKEKSLGDPSEIISHLQKAVYYMVENKGPKNNEDAFWDHFGQYVDKDAFYKFFDEFYRIDFPRLKYLTKPNPYAKDVVKLAFDLGLKVVIATNAVFPLIAIKERLSWAGVDNFPYFLITSMENMHACKPSIEYYEEILEIVGEEPESCLMVGNDIKEDLIAKKLLINTYLISDDRKVDVKSLEIKPDFIAPLKDLMEILPLLSKA